MSSLVADYGSEEDISDDDIVSTNGNINFTSKGQNSNLLISQDGEEGDDSSSDSGSEDNSSTTSPNTNKQKLPNPLCQEKLTVTGKNTEINSIGMSVFTNRYKQAELAKSSILEKHVQMTENHPERGTKQVCWKFKKGKCHMGKKCRFFHDQSNITNFALKKDDQDECSDQLGQHSFNPGHSFGTFVPEPEDDDNYMAGKKRKKKTGVSAGLVPPKQAMLKLHQQRQSERPWTVKK